jgi:hypothetical protein
MKKPLKITQNHAKLSQEHSKKLTKSVVFRHSKWLFISGPNQLAHVKIIEKRPKKSQNFLFKSLRVFDTPKWIFISSCKSYKNY